MVPLHLCVYIYILYPHQRQRRFSYVLHFSPQLQELLEYMPGPDFPTGGIIMGNQGYVKFLFHVYFLQLSKVMYAYLWILISVYLIKDLRRISIWARTYRSQRKNRCWIAWLENKEKRCYHKRGYIFWFVAGTGWTCLFSNFQDLSNVFPLKQIPYQTNKASLVEKIAELVEDKVLLEKNVISEVYQVDICI